MPAVPKACFVLCALFAGSGMAAELDRPEEVVIVGMRTLEGAELARYRSIETEIQCMFGSRRRANDVIDTAQRLKEMISASELFPAAKDSLTATLQEQAFAGSGEPLSVARGFLAATSPDLRQLAFNYLMNADGWELDQAIRDELLRLLSDAGRSADERGTIVWLFASKGLFGRIQELAFSLARDHGDPDLAHRVARAIVSAHEDDADELARFAISGDARALREEAMRSVYRCGDVRLAFAAAAFLAIARDKSEPEWVRGDAIETLARCPGDPNHQMALVELLNRSSWFFGAAGQHFAVHSLALVIPPLAESGNPALRARLVALRPDLSTLRSGEREYVEWVLGNALGEHREIFHGPVEP